MFPGQLAHSLPFIQFSVRSNLNQEELEEALEDRNFSYPGSFYHASLLPSAPNPYFAISGLGIVGLPLNDRDARRIISCATLAPFGKGERTLIDKDVRNTWELDSARISFANHKWAKYIKDEVCVEVCKSLGVDLGDNPPQLELYKLLLYEKGSQCVYTFLLRLNGIAGL